ncbi:hypothetical protein [Lysobacter sp. CA199]|uniref:hypothetical protein n=1 Tax=Lysobacter sp. CA199 TaxID=3455608 RepID=UPI003F8D33C5
MSTRQQLDRELARLERMLPEWRGTLRHEALFWPQFRALVDQISEGLGRADRRYVEERIARMLTLHGCDPGKRHVEGW